MQEHPFSCTCGRVRGVVLELEPGRVNRALCYCRDCRAALRWLDRLDLAGPNGGSDIVQVAQGNVRIDHGRELLACVRLSPKGLFRHYATCCRTPLGNTMRGLPFVGLLAGVLGEGAKLPAPVPIWAASALPPLPPEPKLDGLRSLARISWLMARWKLRGLDARSPYLRLDGKKRVFAAPVRVLTPRERAACADPVA